MPKKCKACQKVKDESEFYKVRTNKDGLHKKCKACCSIDQKERYAADSDTYKQRVKEYRARNPEKVKVFKKTFWEKSREKENQRKREARRKHREELEALGLVKIRRRRKGEQRVRIKRDWQAINARRAERDPDFRAKRSEQTKKWKSKNPDKINFYSHKRRILKKQVLGEFSLDDWKRLCGEFGDICLRCGKMKKLTIDHVVPLSLGGSNYLFNIQPLCKNCNSSKHDKIIDYRPYIPKWVELKFF